MDAVANRRLELARRLLERADDLHAQMAEAAASSIDAADDDAEAFELPDKTQRVSKAVRAKVLSAKDQVEELGHKAARAKQALASARLQRDRALNGQLSKSQPRSSRAKAPPLRDLPPPNEQESLINQCRELSVALHREQMELRTLRERETALRAVLSSMPSTAKGTKTGASAKLSAADGGPGAEGNLASTGSAVASAADRLDSRQRTAQSEPRAS